MGKKSFIEKREERAKHDRWSIMTPDMIGPIERSGLSEKEANLLSMKTLAEGIASSMQKTRKKEEK